MWRLSSNGKMRFPFEVQVPGCSLASIAQSRSEVKRAARNGASELAVPSETGCGAWELTCGSACHGKQPVRGLSSGDGYILEILKIEQEHQLRQCRRAGR